MTAGSDDAAALADTIALMQRAHATKLALCDQLEEIADSLPNELCRRKCLIAARSLGPMLGRIHRFEEKRIFPAYLKRFSSLSEGLEIVERLQHEHFEDEGYAAELRHALRVVARRGRADNSETLGFMLRGFFGAVRRHVAFERDHVIALMSA